MIATKYSPYLASQLLKGLKTDSASSGDIRKRINGTSTARRPIKANSMIVIAVNADPGLESPIITPAPRIRIAGIKLANSAINPR